jgi:membrane peptidoglycan carboxypeptidase
MFVKSIITKIKLTHSIIFILVFVNAKFIFPQDLPPINIQYASYAVSEDGVVFGYFGDKDRVDVRSTGYVSKYLLWSLLATEDRDFYNHGAVSVKGIIRGIFKTITGHIQGGSTLTMQLARNLFLSNERTITRKITEIELAEKLEKKYTKDQILLMYLNTVYFGQGAYGIWAASEEYYGKTPDKLSITEGAALAGLVQSPGGYDPVKHPGRMLARRNEVLHNLVEVGKINEQEFNRLKNTPLGLNLHRGMGKYYLEQVRKEAVEILRPKGLYLDQNELKITTAMDFTVQKAADDAVNLQWNLFSNSMKAAQVGLISIEPGTGRILAIIGGNPDANPLGLNRAVQIKRQPGSSFKAFLYGSLLQKGYTLGEPLMDKPIVVDSGTTSEWRPQNDDGAYTDAPMPMETAIKHSVNLCAAYAISHLTSPDSVVAFAHQVGIQSDLPAYPSIALGTGDVSPLEMASSYAVFADDGVLAKPYAILKIEDKNGNVLYRNPGIDTSTVLDSATSYLVTSALKTVLDGGTASTVRRYYRGVGAGKTGTSQNYTDAWFVGVTPKISTAIWIGYDDPRRKLSGGYQYGGTACAPIWGRMMAEITRSKRWYGYTEFSRPSDINDVEICEDTGEPVKNILTGQINNCSNKKVYPVNMETLQDIYALHNPVVKKNIEFDINVGW